MGAKRPRAPRVDREQRGEGIPRTAMEAFATRGYGGAFPARAFDRAAARPETHTRLGCS
ncbi:MULTISPECIES: hypothetical protein [Nocardiopsis]|uniref:Uncharacterized protein n=1 Tax=Nocardiopsis sinuspersici TaxID=501010 RepID=A0A7Z0BKB7_9ACTN|nr:MULTISPECIES: hypothetical protein [Nocardiopsis]NYH52234.1 hypothetical protein [Nocardiopsis sinuspersici]